MNVLVTGGAGYLGSHIIVNLIESGFDVVIIDNFVNSSEDNIRDIEKITRKKIKYYNLDLKSYDEIEKVFKENELVSVIHLAAYKSVGESISLPLKYYENNLGSTINLLNLCKKYNVNKFVFSSSAIVYGNQKSPVTESESTSNISNPYGETKIMCEKIIKDYANSNKDFKVTILRYFNPIGAHPSGLIGENIGIKPDNLMPYIAKVAKGEQESLFIYGKDYPTKDGTGIRDYIHVMDLADGHVLALREMKNKINIYNLGTGNGTSVLELITTFEKVNNIKINYTITERREGDIAVSYADTSKIFQEIGWASTKNLEEMCKDAWNYITKFKK